MHLVVDWNVFGVYGSPSATELATTRFLERFQPRDVTSRADHEVADELNRPPPTPLFLTRKVDSLSYFLFMFSRWRSNFQRVEESRVAATRAPTGLSATPVSSAWWVSPPSRPPTPTPTPTPDSDSNADTERRFLRCAVDTLWRTLLVFEDTRDHTDPDVAADRDLCARFQRVFRLIVAHTHYLNAASGVRFASTSASSLVGTAVAAAAHQQLRRRSRPAAADDDDVHRSYDWANHTTGARASVSAPAAHDPTETRERHFMTTKRKLLTLQYG